MARFILIDRWLADVGGHNFQYALDVLESAEAQGYQPVLAVHRSLPSSFRLPASWNILRLFRFEMSSHYWLGPDGKRPHPCDLDGKRLEHVVNGQAEKPSFFSRLTEGLARHDRRRRILDLARGCSELCDLIKPTTDDVLFLPSMSESDLLGVVRFLRDDPRSAPFTWHLQFHFNIFSGRDPEFAKQGETLGRFQRQFRAALSQVPDRHLQFYATTDQMARQFDKIGIAKFTTLPYPVRDLARESNSQSRPNEATSKRPLRVTFAGAMRREKGRKQFGSLIAAVWSDCLATRRLQFVFQAKPRQVAGWLPHNLRTRIVVASPGSPDEAAHLRTVRHPLDAQAYHEFIRQTDIGLFLYDSRRYFARASGILGEMLAAGIPVIVPAGCWLGDQLSPQLYRHVESLRENFALESRNVPLRLDARHLTESYEVPIKASDVAIQFPCPREVDAGTFFEITSEFDQAESANELQRSRTIVGPNSAPRDATDIGIVFPIPSGAVRMRVNVAWAYQVGAVPLDTIRITALKPPATHKHHPRSRIGLIATSEDEVPTLLREMTEHYEHFRSTAQQYSSQWLAEHHPCRTIEILSESTRIPRRVAEFAEVF